MTMVVEEGDGGGGDWVKEAMKDELIVAELLIRLKKKKKKNQDDDSGSSSMTSLEWGIRQPRSRQVMIRCSSSNNNNNQNQTTTIANTVQIQKEGGGGESTRASPTTPLSWSTGGCGSGGGGGGGDGVSICGGGGDGYEDSSKLIRQRPPTSAASLRSIKVNGTSESNNRRQRKRKTFAELKEEESLMLKERFRLKKELATLRRSWEEEKARNNQLKRIKVDLQHKSSNQRVTTVISREVIYNQSLVLPMVLIGARHDVGMSVLPATLTPSNEPKENEARQSLFELPDLNEPFGEDSGPEVLYGIS